MKKLIYALQIQSIMEMNGGSVIAMVGKGCVAIASDLRLGYQNVTIACNHEKVSLYTCEEGKRGGADSLCLGLPYNR